jgi:hypothetical protein
MSERDVLAALEAATVGSRELDELVWFATGGVQPKGLNGYFAPPYTTNVELALELVPAGWPRRISEGRFGCWVADLLRGDKSWKQEPDVSAVHTTPALALCLAALRARQSHPAASEGEG